MGLLDIFDTGDTTDPPSGERGPPRTGIDIDTDLERDIARLQAMGDYEFEHFVADIWTAMGWETDVSTQSNDQGIDVIAENHFPYPECAMIQAKRYGPNTTVGSPEIQQYHSLKHQQHGVDKVIVVTTSTFTRQAIDIAEQLNVKLVDGATILHLLDDLDRLDLLDEYVPLPAIERVEEDGDEEIGPEDGWVNDPPSDVAQGDADPDADPVHEHDESRLESIRAEVSHPTSSIVSATRVWESIDSEHEPIEFLNFAVMGWWVIASAFIIGILLGSDAFLGVSLLVMVVYSFISWFAIPIAVWADRGRTPTAWHPSSLWPVGMAFPPLQGVLLGLYLRRREEVLSVHEDNETWEREQRGPSIAQTSETDPRSRSMETPEDDPRAGDDDSDSDRDADVRGYD